MFAAANWEKIHAVGGVILRRASKCMWEAKVRMLAHPAALVKYARNAVPERITGSCRGRVSTPMGEQHYPAYISDDDTAK